MIVGKSRVNNIESIKCRLFLVMLISHDLNYDVLYLSEFCFVEFDVGRSRGRRLNCEVWLTEKEKKVVCRKDRGRYTSFRKKRE